MVHISSSYKESNDLDLRWILQFSLYHKPLARQSEPCYFLVFSVPIRSAAKQCMAFNVFCNGANVQQLQRKLVGRIQGPLGSPCYPHFHWQWILA